MQTTPPTDQEIDELIELMTSIGRKNSLRDPLSSLMADSDLTPTQFHVVMWLHKDQPLTMGGLAQRLGITDKTITGIVDRLERDGYVVRDRGGQDRRVVHVRLAPRGEVFAGDMDREFRKRMGMVLGLLEKKDRSDLVRIIQTLSEKLVNHFGAAQTSADS